MNTTVVNYPSDLSEAEWLKVQAVLSKAKKGGRPPTHSKRILINAILYVIATNCGWRNLPPTLPPWPAVYGAYRRWRLEGSWSKIYECLHSTKGNPAEQKELSVL